MIILVSDSTETMNAANSIISRLYCLENIIEDANWDTVKEHDGVYYIVSPSSKHPTIFEKFQKENIGVWAEIEMPDSWKEQEN